MEEISREDAIKFLKAHSECEKKKVKGICEECNEELCDNCDLCYAQGNCGEHIKATDKAIRTIRDLQSKSEEVCEWKLFDEETNAYNTTCGGAFWFNDVSPKDNGFKYCPYCGRKIKVVE